MGCGASRANAALPDPAPEAFAGAPPANVPAAPTREVAVAHLAEIQKQADKAMAAAVSSAAGPAQPKEPTATQQAEVDQAAAVAAPPEAPIGYQPTEAQLAAAQKVNAEQDARAAAAEALPEERKRQRYTVNSIGSINAEANDGDWIWAGGPQLEEMVQKMDLIDLRYVVPLIEAGGVMPRWQDLPKSARITVHNLWRLNTMVKFGTPLLAVLVLSYPWLDREHPDRLGEQLRALLPLFKLALAELKEHPHHTFGLMMDYGCLPQKPFASDEEKQRFKRGLQNINKWYIHPKMFTLCLTGELPTGAEYTNARLHKQRGWCRFEIAAASLIKHRLCLLDVPMLNPEATTFNVACGSMKKGRAPPQAPPAFADEMRADVAGRAVAFTAGADMEFVIGQYTHGFEEAFNSFKEKGYGLLSWDFLGWGDAQAPRLLAALEYVRDHYPEGAAKMAIGMFDGNTFSEETKAKIKQLCKKFARVS